jgi:hypothetical protein
MISADITIGFCFFHALSSGGLSAAKAAAVRPFEPPPGGPLINALEGCPLTNLLWHPTNWITWNLACDNH